MRHLTPITPANRPYILAVIDANPKLAKSTKARYRRVITGYLDAGGNLSDAEALAAYSRGLSKSGRSFLKAAIKLWGESVALRAKAGAAPETVNATQATIDRIEALNEAIRVEATKGNKAHTWLTQAEVKQLMDTCDTRTLQGQRDKIVLGLLVGAGLRRGTKSAEFDRSGKTIPLFESSDRQRSTNDSLWAHRPIL